MAQIKFKKTVQRIPGIIAEMTITLDAFEIECDFED
jgi:hypothetical protein